MALSRPWMAVSAIGLVAALGVGGYYGYTEVSALRQEAAQADGLRSQLGRARERADSLPALKAEVSRLEAALREARTERDRLADQVAACGEAGCAGLAEQVSELRRELDGRSEALAAAEARLAEARQDLEQARETLAGRERALTEAKAQLTEREGALEQARSRTAGLEERLATLQAANEELEQRLSQSLSRETGRQVALAEVLRMGPFDIGSHSLPEARLAELEQALRPYKGEPLLVVGIADNKPYDGPSAELKQLGLMLARARIVEQMGYKVYYQVRQGDPRVPESRGLIVYRLSLGEAMAEAGTGGPQTAAVPTFYVSSAGTAPRQTAPDEPRGR